ncbi:MAG: zeta toxin family protein [Eubacteriales bacterium]
MSGNEPLYKKTLSERKFMVVLIAGASHTGKTYLAQRLLEKYKYPYLSLDHLKMGLIRSGMTKLTPEDDDELTVYLWKIVREIIKTAVENRQNLIIEGCYFPFDWRESFDEKYLEQIRFYCLVMSEKYIMNHFADIKNYAGVIEDRLDDSGLSIEELISDNSKNRMMCEKYGCDYILIDNEYRADIEL